MQKPAKIVCENVILVGMIVRVTGNLGPGGLAGSAPMQISGWIVCAPDTVLRLLCCVAFAVLHVPVLCSFSFPSPTFYLQL